MINLLFSQKRHVLLLERIDQACLICNVSNLLINMFLQIGFILAPSINNLPQTWERCKNDTTTCSPDQIEILKGLYTTRDVHTHIHASDSALLELIHIYIFVGFRSEFLSALPRLGNGSFRGMFISSCLAHCQSQLQLNWNWDPGFRIEDKVYLDIL